MTEDETTEPETAPEKPEASTPPAPAKEPEAVTLRVASFLCTTFTFPEADGGTLTVTREGVEVPAKDADDLIETAAKHGVTLTRSN